MPVRAAPRIHSCSALTRSTRYDAAADKLVKVWSVLTGVIIWTMEGHEEGLNDVAWSGDSAYLASASDDKTIKIWNVDSVCVHWLQLH